MQVNCKRCHAPLPATGYICNHCGAMMSQEQIEMQKENLKNQPQRIELVSEKYGHKKQIFEARETKKKSNYFLFLILGVFFLLLLVILFVYFYKN